MKKFFKSSECKLGQYYVCGLSGKTMLCYAETGSDHKQFRYWDEYNNEYRLTSGYDGQFYEHPLFLPVE
jgi:hypothetical protein